MFLVEICELIVSNTIVVFARMVLPVLRFQ